MRATSNHETWNGSFGKRRVFRRTAGATRHTRHDHTINGDMENAKDINSFGAKEQK